jgi:hypothetical protein
MFLHGEGAEVDKNDPKLLSALEELYSIIAQYDPENVYNMDEIGLFFRLLPKYSIMMPNEDIRGKKKAKDRVSLIVCANTSGTHKIPCVMIGKPKELTCIKDRHWPVPYSSIKRKHGCTWKLARNGSTKSLFQKSKDEQDVPFFY